MNSVSVVQEFRDKPSKVHKDKNRYCQHHNCTVKLSIYNFTIYCSVHESNYYKTEKSI